MILNWTKKKTKRTPTDELRELLATLKQNLADEHHCRTIYDEAASKRLAILEKQMKDVRDCMEALTKLTSSDEIERNCGYLHMLRRTLFREDG
jgi:hypothetical protein